MRKTVVAICFMLLCGKDIIQPPHASADFSETFLGSGTDGDFFDVWEGWSARFAFNMTASGDTATLFNASGGQVGRERLPTLKVTGSQYPHHIHQVKYVTLMLQQNEEE